MNLPPTIKYAIPALVVVVGLLVYFGRIDYDRMPERIVVGSYDEALELVVDEWFFRVEGCSMAPFIPCKPAGEIAGLAVLDDTPYRDLGIGDVVIYVGSRGKVIHMIASKHGDRFMLRGIGNERVDTYYLTEDMFIGRVERIYIW